MQLTCPRCHKTMPPLARATDAQGQSVVADMAAGRLIYAIKTVREITNCGLKEAKDYVDCTHVPLAQPLVMNPMPAKVGVPVSAPQAARAPFQGKAMGRYQLRQLPEELQKKLSDLSQGWAQPGHAAVRTESVGGAIFGLVLGLGLIGAGLGFFTNYHRLPTHDLIYKCAPLVFAGTFFVLGSIASLLRQKRSALKPSFVVNPAVLVRAPGGDVIEVYRLAALNSVRPIPGFAAELRFGEKSVRVNGGRVEDLKVVVEMATLYHRSNSSPSEAIAKEHDWLSRLEEEREVGASSLGCLPRLVFATAVTAALLIGSWVAKYVYEEQDHYEDAKGATATYTIKNYLWFADMAKEKTPAFIVATAPLEAHRAEMQTRYDDARFKEAVDKKTAGALREYMKEFPKGGHFADAKKALHDLYADAEARYVAHAKAADPKALEGMKALLGHLREQDDPKVGIVYMPVEGLDGALIEEFVKKQTGSSKVAPVGPAFTKERNERREYEITKEMQSALRSIFSDDLFLLEAKDQPGVRFVVRHKVKGSGDWYTRKQEDKLPLAERDVFVGIYVDFEVTLEVGAEKFPVKIVARPAPNFSVRSTASVYDVMAETAFSEFQQKVIAAYGFGK